MKTKLTIVALLVALSFNSFAQQLRESRQRMDPAEREQMLIASANRQTEQMKELLSLDEEQEEAVNRINLRYAVLRTQVTEAARAQEGANLRELLAELEAKREAEILPVLNENQMEIFINHRKEQQERRDQMRQRVDERRQERNNREQN
jgi:hypothetical protein